MIYVEFIHSNISYYYFSSMCFKRAQNDYNIHFSFFQTIILLIYDLFLMYIWLYLIHIISINKPCIWWLAVLPCWQTLFSILANPNKTDIRLYHVLFAVDYGTSCSIAIGPHDPLQNLSQKSQSTKNWATWRLWENKPIPHQNKHHHRIKHIQITIKQIKLHQ